MARRKKQLTPSYPWVQNGAWRQSAQMIGHWAGGPSGSGVLWDMSATRTHGTLGSFASPFTNTSGWGPGLDGGQTALYFDGSNDGVTWSTAKTAANYYFGINSAFSVSFWIKPGTQVGTHGFIIGVRAAPIGPDGAGWFCYYDKAQSRVDWAYYGNNLKLNERDSTAGGVPTGRWTHVCLTRDRTNTMAGTKTYINGLNDPGTTSDTGVPDDPQYNPAVLGLGRNPQLTNLPYLGAIEDVRIFNGCLTPNEVRELYGVLTRNDVKYAPGKRRFFLPDQTASLPLFGAMECAYATRLRDKPRVDSVTRKPTMAEIDPLALAALELSEDRYLSADANELIRALFGLPRSNFWKEPMQAAVDDEALTVPNPEQEQSKFVEFETATRALCYKRWLQSTYWSEPIQGKIDPRALMLVDPVDATYSRSDMQDLQAHAAFLKNDRRRLFSSTFGQTDLVTLALQEAASADKFTEPSQMRLLPRPPVTYTYGHSITEPSLIPEDPPSLFMRSWWTALAEPVRLPLNRLPRHFYPVGTLDLDNAQRPETIYQAFEGPWRSPRWTRAIRGHFYPIGDLGIDNADRPERIAIDEFRRLFDEPMRARARILAGQVAVAALLIDPAAAGETITVDKFLRPFDVPHEKEGLFRGLMQIAVSEYDATTFSQPPIVKFIRSMLNAGF